MCKTVTSQSNLPFKDSKAVRVLGITRPVLEEIRWTIGNQFPERGGMLGGNRADGVVHRFYYDQTARQTGSTYSPDYTAVNRLLSEDWNPKGIDLLGFVHSHPSGMRYPSSGDLEYAREILEHNPQMDCLLLPIVMSDSGGREFEFLPFAVLRDGEGVRVDAIELSTVEATPVTPIDLSTTYARVRDAYDLGRMALSRVIYVGVGGAASFAEELARAGVQEHILIDPDVISETNLATQQVYRKDLGRAKVDCVSERIGDINPNAVVIARRQRLEEIDDYEFVRLAKLPLRGQAPEVTLICGLTDSFEAQARVNRLALQFGLPSLCAQLYREGRGAEITFTYPGVTPACHRCILSSRYKAYLEEGFQNDVTSHGAPIFATARLNALKGFIALALLHHGMIPFNLTPDGTCTLVPQEKPSYRRWGTLLERIGNRNLIQIRMDPDLEQSLGLKVFDRVFGGGDRGRILFDEAVWLPQKPDGPEAGVGACPDCGGSGNLRDAMGKFQDTRLMPR